MTGDIISTTFDDTVFAATNMGTFHAIDADTGDELFSFVPQELLPNLTTYYKSAGGFSAKIYGLDGEMTVWRYDANDDGSITTGVGSTDHVYIYQPMRRGGTDIYAFDVTSRTNPKLLWQINGTALDITPAGDYQDLAQTWSALQRAKIEWCVGGSCTTRTVLFFGGGYDPAHDTATSPLSSSKGNAIYMIDAETSELLWSAGDGIHHDFNSSAMKHSFAADVTVSDVDGDGNADFLFAVNIQGDVWRFDFDKTATTVAAFATGGIIADLSSTGSDFRRFYNAPDVAYFTERGEDPFLTVSVASGHRADPRETAISDYLFVIFDPNALVDPSTYNYAGGTRSIAPSDLSAAGATPVSVYGWKLALTGTGEKGLSRTVTFDGNILMTSFLPNATTSCDGSTGEGRYYLLNALTGDTELIDDKGTVTTSDDVLVAYKVLDHGGIPPEPAIIFGTKNVCVSNCSTPGSEVYEKHSDLTACIGTECVDDDIDLSLHKTYWREN